MIYFQCFQSETCAFTTQRTLKPGHIQTRIWSASDLLRQRSFVSQNLEFTSNKPVSDCILDMDEGTMVNALSKAIYIKQFRHLLRIKPISELHSVTCAGKLFTPLSVLYGGTVKLQSSIWEHWSVGFYLVHFYLCLNSLRNLAHNPSNSIFSISVNKTSLF
jgi:hypothetical protein